MSDVVSELRKLAWIESVFPQLGASAPVVERLTRRGSMNLISQALQEDKPKKRKDGSR